VSEPITDERLRQIEERLMYVSEGPWTTFEGDRDNPDDYDGDWPNWRGVMGANDVPIIEQCRGDSYPDRILNADFIANARQDVPDLVAEARRLREVLSKIALDHPRLGFHHGGETYHGFAMRLQKRAEESLRPPQVVPATEGDA
jgi:hypothetical protein